MATSSCPSNSWPVSTPHGGDVTTCTRVTSWSFAIASRALCTLLHVAAWVLSARYTTGSEFSVTGCSLYSSLTFILVFSGASTTPSTFSSPSPPNPNNWLTTAATAWTALVTLIFLRPTVGASYALRSPTPTARPITSHTSSSSNRAFTSCSSCAFMLPILVLLALPNPTSYLMIAHTVAIHKACSRPLGLLVFALEPGYMPVVLLRMTMSIIISPLRYSGVVLNTGDSINVMVNRGSVLLLNPSDL